MPRTRARRWSLLAFAGLALTLSEAGPSTADACGSFRSRRVDPEQTPSLAREKVLLVHDSVTRRQHFIREIAFVRAREPFGFVVPTPTRPEVAEVAKTPFTKLRANFPFAPVARDRSTGARSGGSKSAGGGVEVLSVEKVGSFTAFVLAADDAEALGKWLADNELVSDEANDAWLAHYVELGFYYVAMRYDPPKLDASNEWDLPSEEVEAETVRISFATPLPYYPYLEPTRPQTDRVAGPRLLELWYVGAAPVVPIATRERDGLSAWVQPLKRGLAHADARSSLARSLEPELAELLPEGPLVVQTFQDQKRVRDGFGDVLFAFRGGVPRTPELDAELEPLLGLLDPALIAAPPSAEAPAGAQEDSP